MEKNFFIQEWGWFASVMRIQIKQNRYSYWKCDVTYHFKAIEADKLWFSGIVHTLYVILIIGSKTHIGESVYSACWI